MWEKGKPRTIKRCGTPKGGGGEAGGAPWKFGEWVEEHCKSGRGVGVRPQQKHKQQEKHHHKQQNQEQHKQHRK